MCWQLEQLVSTQKLYTKTAAKIERLPKADQNALLKFIRDFRLGINYAREFVDYLIDISRRDGVTISKQLKDPTVIQIFKENKLAYSRRMDLLREALRQKRYPYFYGGEEGPWGPVKAGGGMGLMREKRARKAEGLKIKTIYVEKEVQDFEVTNKVLEHFKKTPVKYIDSIKEVIKKYQHFGEGKQIVTLAKQKGRWLERCPGTREHLCCNYLVVNNAINCPFDCTYCYLQTYLNNKVITIYANIDELIAELKQFMDEHINEHFRIGTGEFTDSLALDEPTGLATKLIELFAGQENHLLELKTKSTEIDHLLGCDHRGKTVFAWSVNPEGIVRSQEYGARSLKERLKAAKRAVASGYKVGFHFDPIIFYKGWDKDYAKVVAEIFKAVKGEDIAWISLGALRYQPQLKEIIEERFPHSRICLGELDIGEDNKMRYFKPIRVEIFQTMFQAIRQHSKDVYVYLCMESPDVWAIAGITNNPANPSARYFKFFKKGAII
ncbi:MAG: spore photoproduct lyase family protein [Patescibacteria group bacterium]